MISTKEKVSPLDGGCWYCETKDDTLVYDTEFDTMIHVECIKQALKEDPNDPEAKFFKYLLK